MGVVVYNISSTSARVSWPRSPNCLDTFYSVMYDPNWNSLLMGYKRKSFMHEERIPVSQTTTHLANLHPQTAYFLCVTCQAANPVREQCQVWLVLLLLQFIRILLLWGCLHTLCSLSNQTTTDGRVVDQNHQDNAASGRLYTPSSSEDSTNNNHGTIIQTPLIPPQTNNSSVLMLNQDHELRSLSKLSGSEPA
uniref:Fibronectin type-III domain-containing protein n=1 Tax=Periophthalmus magnuspinnatus TaxID=409849 RepID=A0A3B3ZI79_9GOBI